MDWIAPLITLTLMEIVLGIDNIIFIAIVVGKLPAAQQPRARFIGLGLALVLRVVMLCGLFFIMSLNAPLFNVVAWGLPADWFPPEVHGHPEYVPGDFSVRDLILLGGGLFLIAKAAWELHGKLEGDPEKEVESVGRFTAVIVQIILLDLVFSIDSVITAIGMVPVKEWWSIYVMILAVMIAIGVMLAFAGPVSNFVHRHPTLKVLALAFLILIGVMLVYEGVAHQSLKVYIYFSMAFALGVELVNMRVRSSEAKKVTLNEPPPVTPRPPAGGTLPSRP